MDYFNENERAKQQRFASYRDKSLRPLISVLMRLGVSPNQLTFIGILFLILGGLLSPVHWEWVGIALVLYCLFDGLDGPLARHSGKANEGGSLVDIVADQLGVVILAAAACYHMNYSAVPAILFSNGYISFIAIAIYCNSKSISLPWYARVKYPFYIAYVADMASRIGIVDWFMLLGSIYYWLMAWVAISNIYKHHSSAGVLKKNDQDS